jgi:hypothetical protein
MPRAKEACETIRGWLGKSAGIYEQPPGASIFRSAVGATKYSTLRANINCYRGEKHKKIHLTEMPRAKEVSETIRGCLGKAQVFSSNPPARAFSGRR